MWNLLKRRNKSCMEFLERLEEAASEVRSVATPKQLLQALASEAREHAAHCANCRGAVEDLLAAREVVTALPGSSQSASPWFVPRVMAAIAAEERERASGNGMWTAVPKLASRLTWVLGVTLLLTSAWLYERPAGVAGKQSVIDAAPETLFETSQPPATHDEVLVSLVEKDR
jgi:hypothetical protein